MLHWGKFIFAQRGWWGLWKKNFIKFENLDYIFKLNCMPLRLWRHAKNQIKYFRSEYGPIL